MKTCMLVSGVPDINKGIHLIPIKMLLKMCQQRQASDSCFQCKHPM